MSNWLAIIVCIRLQQLYNQAKDKHRKEILRLLWFSGKQYGDTGIIMPRAYIPFFAGFERQPYGLVCEAVQVLIFNEFGQLLICHRDPTRQKIGKLDIGAAGMMNVEHKTKHDAIREEMQEELSLDQIPTYMTTVTPANGFNCIIHIFGIVIRHDTPMQSVDGTYTKIEWIDCKKLSVYKSDLKHDAKKLLEYFKLC